MKISFLILIAILLNACSRPKIYTEEWVNANIKPKMTKDEVVKNWEVPRKCVNSTLKAILIPMSFF